MSFLKLPTVNRIVSTNSKCSKTNLFKITTSSKFNSNGGSRSSRNYSSFSMKPDEEHKSFNFKPFIALALVGGVGAYLYHVWDNQDLMFSTKLPFIQKEELDKFKSLMKELKEKKEILTEEKQKIDEIKQSVDELKEIKHKEEELDHKYHNHNEEQTNSETEQSSKLDLISLVESNQNEQHEHIHNTEPTPTSEQHVDEINADEREADSESFNLENEITNLINQHTKEEEQVTPVGKEQEPTTTEPLYLESTESTPSDLEITETTTSNNQDESLIREIIDNVLSIIPTNIGEERVENVLKLLEKQYLDMVQTLIAENIKLKNEVENIIENKQEEIKSVEETIKQKYRDSLDATIEKLNESLNERLSDMDKFIWSNLNDNKAILESTLEKQKSNLLNIFKQQSESIKQSELEKRALTQLTRVIVDIEKLLNLSNSTSGDSSSSSSNAIIKSSINTLKDLSNYDELIKELLESLPKGFENKTIVAKDTLVKEFNSLAKQVRKTTLLDPNDNSLIGKAVSSVASLFILPGQGMLQGTDYDSILSRAEEYLRKGDLSMAIKEMESIHKKYNISNNDADNKHLITQTNSWISLAKERDQLENISKLLQLKLDLIHKQQQSSSSPQK